MTATVTIEGLAELDRTHRGVRLPRAEDELPRYAFVPHCGRMPWAAYIGIWAHWLIGKHYEQTFPHSKIYIDHHLEAILQSDGLGQAVPQHRKLRPDIYDATLGEVWEIKPYRWHRDAGTLLRYSQQFELYYNVLGRARRGRPNRATSGQLPGPGGDISFTMDPSKEGFIFYEHIRKHLNAIR
jgi:hypothetical protein